MAEDVTMRQNIRLGTYGGVPVGVHWSVAVIFALVTWELAEYVLPGSYPGTRGDYWAAAVVAAVLFFASLLAHEVSHAVVARRFGVTVRSITLWLFGGVAQLGSEALTPGADFQIAAAGPAVSVLLVGVFAAAQWLLSSVGAHGLVVAVPTWLWEMNLLLAAFNLVPAAPLDGGRILRAGIWWRSGDRTRASVVAARVGRVFGVLLIALGVVFFFRYDEVYGLWPAFLGWFLFSAARSEERAARLRQGLDGVRVGEVMTAQPPALPSSTSVAELIDRHLPWYRVDSVAVVGPTGWLEGILPLERVQQLHPLARADTSIGSLAYPIRSVPVGRPEESIQTLLQRMADSGGLPAVVLDANNRLAGIVTTQDVNRSIQKSLVGSRS